MTNICATQIPLAVTKFRNDHSIPSFCGNTLEKPFVGGQCLVYKIRFSDNATWAVRFPVRLTPAAAVSAIIEENEILKELGAKNFPWSPKYVGEELERNPVGFPFSLYVWIPGAPLVWAADFPTTRPKRKRFINQLAEVHWSLLFRTRRRGPHHESVTDHVTRITDHRIVRICRGTLPSIRIRDCFHHRNLVLQKFADSSRDDPRCIGHNDLSAQNIVVDQDLNITVILDWSFAAEEPFQLAAAMPKILRPRPGYEGPIYENDQADFIEALAKHAGLDPEEQEFMGRLVALYTPKGAEYLQKLLEAIGSRSAFQALAETFPCQDLITLDVDINDFLKRKVGVRSGLSEEEVRSCL